MSKRKSGLGKSLQHMFGEDKIRQDFLKKQQQEIFDEVDDVVAKEEVKEVEPEEVNKVEEPRENQKQEHEDVDAKSVVMVKINLVQPNLSQPRKNFDEEKLQELSESISKYGILQPLIVKQNGAMYEIIAGERRWRAAKQAGFEEVPVLIKKYDNKTSKEVALIENIQRENLNPVEEALAYKSLIEEFGLTQDEVASRVSKNRSTVTNSLRILKLNKKVLDMIQEGKLTQGHARALLAIEDESLREKIAEKILEENLSVRDIENLVKLEKANKKKENKPEVFITDEMKQLKIIIKDLEKTLKDKLKTKVKINQKGNNNGKIEIEYYGKEDLDRLFLLIKSINN